MSNDKGFWNAVGIPFEIKTIKAKTLNEAVSVAYQNNDCCFYGSYWFLDVKKKFRIFKFNNATFIVKQVSEKTANLELTNSITAKTRIDKKVIGTKTIKIIVPKKIKLSFKNERCFLVSEYLGLNMNEGAYINLAPCITLQECLTLIRLLLENNISYRGFLPRNTVLVKNTIYLFDWEDTRFGNNLNPSVFDHLWKTQFLLNWSYLFSFDAINSGLKNITKVQSLLKEPDLMSFEKIFRTITNDKNSISSLRNNIDTVVFGAELPIKKNYDHFYIHPNDIGCLIADIFPSEIDVLHDILTYVFRKQCKDMYIYHIHLITHMLILYYNSVLIQKHNPKLELQDYIIILMLMMLDEYIDTENYKNISSASTLDELIEKIVKTYKSQSISRLYISHEEGNIASLLTVKLQARISNAFPSVKINNKSFKKINQYILNKYIKKQK